MRKIIIAATAVLALASCSKEGGQATENTKDGIPVTVVLGHDEQTRTFFDQSATPEPWESQLNSLYIYCYDEAGVLVIRRVLTPGELSAKSAAFSLPNSSAGKTYSFYAVANSDTGIIPTASQMEGLVSPDAPLDYHGTFASMSAGCLRADGFVMSGKTSALITGPGATTPISINLKRVVAKVAVRTTLSDDFIYNSGGGVVVITGAKLDNAAKGSYLYPPAVKPDNYALTTLTQNPGGTNSYDNLFYLSENGKRTGEDKVTLTLTGYYDRDGDLSTTGDRLEVEYTVLLDGHGDGEIMRNAYYRLDLSIKGLSGSDLIVTFTVADWETPITQNVDLGV